jgi:hypothetical protein
MCLKISGVLVDCTISFHGHTFILIGIVGSGVQLRPLGTAATNRPIVTVPQCRFVHHKPHMLPGREPVPPRWEASH